MSVNYVKLAAAIAVGVAAGQAMFALGAFGAAWIGAQRAAYEVQQHLELQADQDRVHRRSTAKAASLSALCREWRKNASQTPTKTTKARESAACAAYERYIRTGAAD